jgi:hypothetical protein
MAYRRAVSLVVGFFVIASVASGCALAKQRRQVELAQRDLIGLSRDSLVACAGEPEHVEEVGDREIIYYVAENPESENHKRASTCVASFTLRRGYVEHLHYETLAGRLVAERESCMPIIETCMSVN